MKKRTICLFTILITAVILFFSSSSAMAFGWLPKPSEPPVEEDPLPPASAPEPLTLTLIGMAASGVGGYYLGGRKKKK